MKFFGVSRRKTKDGDFENTCRHGSLHHVYRQSWQYPDIEECAKCRGYSDSGERPVGDYFSKIDIEAQYEKAVKCGFKEFLDEGAIEKLSATESQAFFQRIFDISGTDYRVANTEQFLPLEWKIPIKPSNSLYFNSGIILSESLVDLLVNFLAPELLVLPIKYVFTANLDEKAFRKKRSQQLGLEGFKKLCKSPLKDPRYYWITGEKRSQQEFQEIYWGPVIGFCSGCSRPYREKHLPLHDQMEAAFGYMNEMYENEREQCAKRRLIRLHDDAEFFFDTTIDGYLVVSERVRGLLISHEATDFCVFRDVTPI